MPKRKRKSKIKNKSQKQKQRQVRIHTISFWILAAGVSLLYVYISVVNNPKLSVYPTLQQYQESPNKFLKAKKAILETALPLPEVVDHGPRNTKKIAVTFDADMTYGMLDLLHKGEIKSWYNKPIIDYLIEKNTKATIFLSGLWVKAYPKESKQIANNPLFEVGNHSYSHPAFSLNCFGLGFIEDGKDESEVEEAQKIIIKTTGVIPEIFRFPGGCYEKHDLETISKLGLTIVHWDVVGGDGFNFNTQSIIQNVENGTQNGSIMVLHLNNGNLAPKTHEALKEIIPYLKNKGFEFVKVSELIN
jgi:peptidoglycan/xylan/chitin deacetylase (PgdA/CDA1 family)